jgi:signal peptide peptidase-like protein 2B
MFLKEVRFPSMETITWALALLFIYDIFFVFVTPYFTSDGVSVMEKVALSSTRPRGVAAALPGAAGSNNGTAGVRSQAGPPVLARPPTWPILLVVPNWYNPLKICGIPGFNALGLGDIFWPGVV